MNLWKTVLWPLIKCPFQEARSDDNEVLVFTRIKYLSGVNPSILKMVRRQYKHLADLENGSSFREIFLDQNGHKLGGDWEEGFKDTLAKGSNVTVKRRRRPLANLSIFDQKLEKFGVI